MSDQNKSTTQEFKREAAAPQVGLLREVLHFLRHTRKWWLAPIIVILLVVGLIVTVGGTVFAPFIYTLF